MHPDFLRPTAAPDVTAEQDVERLYQGVYRLWGGGEVTIFPASELATFPPCCPVAFGYT